MATEEKGTVLLEAVKKSIDALMVDTSLDDETKNQLLDEVQGYAEDQQALLDDEDDDDEDEPEDDDYEEDDEE